MEKRDKLLQFIDGLLKNGAVKLKRGFGIGLYLYNQLRDTAPPYVLENLQLLDRMPFEKKKAMLLELRRFLESSRERSRRDRKVEKKRIKDFLVPLDKLKFLDSKELKVLKSLGINTLLDALFFFPLRYEDRRPLSSLKLAKVGEKVVLKLKVKGSRRVNDGRYTAEVVCTDGSEEIKLKFRFKKADFIHALYRKGSEVVVLGKLRSFNRERYIVHPELLKEGEYGSVFPIYYVRTKGEVTSISSKTRQNRIREALRKTVKKAAKYLPEYLPESVRRKYGFPEIDETVELLHFPEGVDLRSLNAFSDVYHRRAIYDDLFLFQLSLLLKKKETELESSPRIALPTDRFISEFQGKLSFKLTNAQLRVLREILLDMAREHPMNRLLQGDVGSGKTVVAIGAALAAVRKGYQVAVMVPTEILAQQHFRKFREFFDEEGIEVGLLTGSLTPAQKRSAYKHIREGNIKVVVGTHALIQEKVEFDRLGLVIIDEQHRFGVMQRKLLLDKGKGLYPHCLVMSATPIPRTLALSVYGDLDVSVIDELPPGRKEVRTLLLYESEKEKLLEAVNRELSLGNKVYVIYPLIDESEKMELKATTEEYERWRNLLPDREVLLLHGRMSDSEKQEVMERFKEEGDVLVSTTVIEVGIDVPEATLMIIEDAHRFGLSQLHQLRGRVGRSDRSSYCYLVVPDSLRRETEALRRLKVLVRTNDGFEVAEMDMKLRGPGELLGVSQSGYFGFRIANLARAHDRAVLQNAREDAQELLNEDPRLTEHRELRELLLYSYGDKLDLSYIA
ncbi:ATP-dependent DNA helicase RecG [Hydrogenivirga sp.]